MDQAVGALRERLREINDIESAAALLEWDQSTYMPEGGAPARARQLATLGRLAHGLRIDPVLGKLVDDARRAVESLDEHTPEAALVRLAVRERERALRLPAEFVSECKSHFATTYVAWTKARPSNDFRSIRPLLEKSVELSRRHAEFYPEAAHPADPHIDDYDMGSTAAEIRTLFSDLREALVPMVRRITSLAEPDDSFLHAHYPAEAQIKLGEEVIRHLGYDFGRGRQDMTHHPFMTRFSLGDVRITTRVRADDLGDALFSTIHECGHALYELGTDPTYDGTPLGAGVSAGVHESQSRLWENLVARSREFWEAFFPMVQEEFPVQLAGVDAEAFYRAINKVKRSLIRVDADEVTYNLHVMIRFDLGLELLEGKLAVRDLPEAWNARYESDLGVRPPDDRDGVLQDVHWYTDNIGGTFQGYTLGNVMSAQFFEAALRARPEIPERIRNGDFGPLGEWLREEIYRHGSVYPPATLVKQSTGKALGIASYVSYLDRKFGQLYEV